MQSQLVESDEKEQGGNGRCAVKNNTTADRQTRRIFLPVSHARIQHVIIELYVLDGCCTFVLEGYRIQKVLSEHAFTCIL